MSKYLSLLSSKNRFNECGGKAFYLSLLKRSGYLVPNGYCLKVKAFEKFLIKNNIYKDILELRRNIEQGKYSIPLLKKIQFAITESDMPSKIVSEIISNLRKYKGMKLAVRSSSLGEDSMSASFAGLMETILEVPAEEQTVIKAIKNVWESLFSERVINYIIKQGEKNTNFLTGVIIQEMLEPQEAGVAFSVHPITMDPEIIYIEETPFRGDKLVSGEVVPKKHLVLKNQINLDTHPDWLNTLVQYTTELEQYFNQPVDIEWAKVEKDINLLQVRPITTLTDKAVNIWTDENVGEVLPQVVTPLTWSIMEPSVNRGFLWTTKMLGLPVANNMHLFQLFQGKAYFKHSLFKNTLNKFFPSIHVKQKSMKTYFTRLFYFIIHELNILLKFLFLLLLLPLKSRELERKKKPGYIEGITSDLNLMQLILLLVENEKKLMRYHIANTLLGEILYQSLISLTPKNEMSPSTLSLLEQLSKIGDARSVSSGAYLQEMTKSIKNYIEIEERNFPEYNDFENYILNNIIVKKDLDKFLDKYGHMSDQEFELAHPRWAEDPSKIIRILYNLINSPESDEKFRPSLHFSSSNITEKRYHKFFKKSIIKLLVNLTKIFYKNRENLKQKFIEIHFELKKVILELQEYFLEKNFLNMPSDIFFLQLSELQELVFNQTNRIDLDIRNKINYRKVLFEKNKDCYHPNRFLEIDGEIVLSNTHTDNEDGLLRGIPCSSGKIDGVARVLHNYSDSIQLKKGEILVTHSANPGWVPLFLLSCGVITEIGGALSHSAIIAREYGIPMIASVSNATRIIRTGDLIEVDGTAGVVKVLNRETV